jgi:hypothetical protein
MATVTTYVDTGVAPGGIGTIGDPYSSMHEWNTQEATDLVTAGDLHVVNLVGVAADTTGDVGMNTWVTGISNFITINGNNNTGAYSTSHYRLEFTPTSSYDFNLLVWQDYTVLNDLQFQVTSDQNSSSCIYIRSDKVDVNRCITKGVLSGTLHSAKGFFNAGSNPGNYHSCLAFDFDLGASARGFYVKSPSAVSYLRNCTAYNCIQSFFTESGNTIAENCLSQSSAEGYRNYSWDFTNSRYNHSEISTADAPGGNSQTGAVAFVDEAGGNFQPAAMDIVAKDNGVDLSAAFNFDLAGNTMPATWPIGCLQATDGIVFDSASDLSNGDGYTADAGSDRIVLVGLSSIGGNPPNPPSTMTLGGNALTLIVYEVDNVGTTGKNHKAFYYIKEADLLTGSQTLSWSWASAPESFDRAIVFTVTGVDQTTSFGDFDSASEDASTSIASGALSVANDDMVMAFCGVSAAATTISDPTGYTNVFNDPSNFGYKDQSVVYKTLAGTGTESPTFTLSTANGGVAVYAVLKRATAGGGGTTITPVTGSISLSGQPVSVFFPSLLSPGVGSLSVVGQSLSLIISTLLSPGAGSLSVDGQGVLLTLEKLVSPGVGSLSVVGQEMSIAGDVNSSPGVGSLSVDGQGVLLTLQKLVSPGTGALSVVGQEMSIAVDVNSSPGVGSLSVVGQDISIVVLTDINITTGSINIDGQSVSLDELRIIAIDNGVLSISGQAVTVDAIFVQNKRTGFITKLVGPLINNLITELL